MKKILRRGLSWLISIIIAFLIVFLLKTFVGMPTTVKGTSMLPSFFPDEKLILSTWSTNFNLVPNRGEIITFEAPSVDLIKNADMLNPVAIYSDANRNVCDKILYYGLGITRTSYIKRVIGLPGDHVEIKNGSVFINDCELEESYINGAVKTDMALGGEFSNLVVPEGYIYVLGDNRTGSADSRRFGCIPVDKIEGKVVFIWWPLKQFGKV